MTTDYTVIAEQYKQCKEHPWRSRIETYSILKHLGNVEGTKVLDVACGEGFYTRKLRQCGADEVVGIDLSEAMIRLALDEESRNPMALPTASKMLVQKAVGKSSISRCRLGSWSTRVPKPSSWPCVVGSRAV